MRYLPALIAIGAIVATLGAACPASAWLASPPLAAIAAIPVRADENDKLAAADLALQGGRLIEAQALLDQIGARPAERGADMVALLRAELMIANGRPGDALPLLRGIVGGDVPVCRFATAYALGDTQNGQAEDAERRLREHEGACTDEPVFWAALGQASLVLQRPAAAVVAYRRAVELRPDNDLLRNDLAVALIANGDAAGAVEILRPLSQRRPEDGDVMTNLDFAGGMMGQMPLRRDADSAIFWSRRLQSAGLGARKMGRTGMAEALFAQALLARPRHDPELWRQYSEVSGVK